MQIKRQVHNYILIDYFLYCTEHIILAIDIWAVGVILLIILAGKYPFFNPDDDADGIIELAHLFGKKELTTFAEHYGK